MSARRVLVIGASSGVGRAAAEMLHARGDRVAVAARRLDALDDFVAAHEHSFAVRLDLRDPEDCEQAVATAIERLGGVDALVMAAGIIELDELVDVDASQWWSILGTNLIGPALVARAAIRELERNAGRIVFVSSIAARRPLPGGIPYGASKAALEAFAEGLGAEHPSVGVSCLALGPVLTGMAAGIDADVLRRRVRTWRTAHGFPTGAMEATDAAAQIVWLLDTRVRVPYAVAVQQSVITGPGAGSAAQDVPSP